MRLLVAESSLPAAAICVPTKQNATTRMTLKQRINHNSR
jgi:hypothetical protein